MTDHPQDNISRSATRAERGRAARDSPGRRRAMGRRNPRLYRTSRARARPPLGRTRPANRTSHHTATGGTVKLTDREAMDRIHQILDQNEWHAETIEWVAEVVEATGRAIQPPEPSGVGTCSS